MKRITPLAAALLLVGCSATADPAVFTVLSVGDGDTISVRNQAGQKVKTRLACLDAPESSQRPAGPAARAALQQLLPVGSQVTLQVKDTDRYGRTIAEVYRGRTNINQALVGDGMAFVYWDYIAGCDRSTYGRLEQQAKSQRLGVWSDPALVAPWDYRRCRRSKSC